MDLHQGILIEAAPSSVFSLVDDPSRYPEFFVGITRWEQCSQRRRGIGARYRVLMRVGSIQAGGTIKVTGHRKDRTIAWESERGITQRGRWELEAVDGSTMLHLHVGFDLSGGPVGWLVEQLTGRIVARNMWATLMAARRLLEQG